MTKLWAIDPGPKESAILRYDLETGRPEWWAKLPNHQVLTVLETGPGIRQVDRLAIEMIACYGMAVGKEVFETCVWIGRFIDRWMHGTVHDEPIRVTRLDCKSHLCHSAKAGDKNVRQALIDRFGPKGTKKDPGLLYGMAGDCWSALAVAVTAAETTPELCSK